MDAPEFSAQLAVDLQRYLLGHSIKVFSECFPEDDLSQHNKP